MSQLARLGCSLHSPGKFPCLLEAAAEQSGPEHRDNWCWHADGDCAAQDTWAA